MSGKGVSNNGGHPHPQPPWRNNSGGGSHNNEEAHPPQPLPRQSSSHHQHHQHHHQHQNRERLEKTHDRDREKNHETVCNLLSMLTLGTGDQESSSASTSTATTATVVDQNRLLLLNLTNSPESCIVLRKAGCIPLLIEILHPPSSPPLGMKTPEIIKSRASRALKNIVQFNPDEKLKRKELKVLKLLEGIRAFSEAVRVVLQSLEKKEDPSEEKLKQTKQHPTANMTTLMKLSFDEEHKNIMCLLGAIHALADLIMCDNLLHGNGNSVPETQEECYIIRRYSCMTLTNLTFGDGTNKALLCGMKTFMDALVSQLFCENEDVCQITASVLRNLSWHADSSSRAALRDSNAVPKLTLAAIKSTKESTLKSTLSALWNLSAHSVANKSAICTASPDALPFLISLLRPNNPLLKTFKTPMTIIENAGGILRNISTQISTSPEHRKILRENHCYEILLEHLKSCSLTVVSNACGTLWNLSGGVGCEEDQRKLLDLNAVPMLKNLIYSKHERISQGASAALRNLLSSRFAKEHMIQLQLDSRLTAHIYSNTTPTPGGNRTPSTYSTATTTQIDANQDSPGSEDGGDFEFEFQSHRSTPPHPPPLPPPEIQPPMAHQHSSAAAASIFHHHRRQQPTPPLPPPPPTTHFIPPQIPAFPHPANYMSRPTSINYSMEPEPLDLTLTSAKSSPIHIISAAEFGYHHSHPHSHSHTHVGRKPGTGKPAFTTMQSQKPFYNPPSLLHQSGGTTSNSNGGSRFNNYPGQSKFNRSCPEILSRLYNVPDQQNINQKPLDFSSNSHSAASSLRGGGSVGAGETQSHPHNDSASGGDTTFNYSLQFTEVDDDDNDNDACRQNASGGEGPSKGEDTLKTYCYEGTPHNFSISNSCQDLVHEIEMENNKATTSGVEVDGAGEKQIKSPKLQPIDETDRPKSYYVENTPAVFSRTSSLSSINSGGMNAGENKAELLPNEGLEKKPHSPHQNHMQLLHPVPIPKQRKSQNQSGSFTPARVTFSAEETPLMFSRCSSVASLDSLDVPAEAGAGNDQMPGNNDIDDNLSDFSRRASEVVSPSDLPDSPRAMEPPVRIYDQHQSPPKLEKKREEGEDDVKVFTIEEKSGLNSCRSLSPLMIDGEVLPVLGKRKLDGESPSERRVEMMPKETPKEGEKKKPNGFSDGPDPDEVKIFAMEGTPFYGVSNATSLSDLTMDFEAPPEGGLKSPLPVVKEGEPSRNDPKDKSLGHSEKNVSVPSSSSQEQSQPNSKEEPIYSDVQLLQKCIRIGKSKGIPKSKSEYKITKSVSTEQVSSSGSSNNIASGKKPLTESKSQHDFDDPDLAALIMKGRNRPKEKEKSKETKVKEVKKGHASTSSESEGSKSKSTSDSNSNSKSNNSSAKDNSNSSDSTQTETDSKEPQPQQQEQEGDGDKKTELLPKPENLVLDPSQISTTSLGSEWNDETPTFSSPIPSMSISTAFKIVGGDHDQDPEESSKSSSGKVPPPQQQPQTLQQQQQSSSSSPPKSGSGAGLGVPPTKTGGVMQSSLLTMSLLNNELLENIDPPSTFSNVVSSSDCILPGSPPTNPKLIGSCSDKLSRKWKALNDAQNTSSSIHSNLSGQRPPLDLDLENSMISVASIKSEIYELSSTASFTNDVFQSAMEDIGSPSGEKGPGTGDHSLGCNTYTIFPPEMGENGKSTDVVSDGNTIVTDAASDDFTDAEEIEDFETAPADDHIVHVGVDEQKEKSDEGKEFKEKMEEKSSPPPQLPPKSGLTFLQQHQLHHNQPHPKPLMEVHPLPLSEAGVGGNKYNTFKIQKPPSVSPRSSPKQKRRDDPERYKTHTIAALNSGKSLLQTNHAAADSNGNPLNNDDTRFATFRVGGPKIVKNSEARDGTKTSQSNSPESTPGNSPKGIRGRRKPLYSSLPPSAIQAKKKQAPPIPPKPSMRNASPVRPSSSASGGGGGSAAGSVCGGGNVYVRPTRASELRANANSRDNSPSRVRSTSRSSSNSSLNNVGHSNNSASKMAELESTFGTSAFRPKVAPKPPVRSSTTTSSQGSTTPKPFSGSSYNVVIKTSNSSFGFGQNFQKVGDGSQSQNMKGYSTLPKSSKLGGEFGGMYMPGTVPPNGNGESKESIPGSEKSQSHGKMNKLTSLFKRMDFHRTSNNSNSNAKDSQSQDIFLEQNSKGQTTSGGQEGPEKKSKFSFFGRKKDKQQKPFLVVDSNNINTNATSGHSHHPNNSTSTASISTRGPTGIWVRRDGENKAMVAPFNYIPPPNHPQLQQQKKEQLLQLQLQNNANFQNLSVEDGGIQVTNTITNTSSSNNSSSTATTTPSTTAAATAAAGSAKITTV